MSNRYVCVHGHFYQPPRENPSLEEIELQDSAYPYHDWNERITADCYAPNTTSRILDGEQRITRMVNNYSTISFNVGPTLLSWMEVHAQKTYATILEADKLSAEKFGGHGSAMAQAYNHMIMPLANRRDKVTQVKWGIADFQRRFKRAPEGMWLPETAVDIETLEVMAEQGLKFTILAPRQASRVRRFGSRSWKDVSGERVDPSRAYLVRLPSRRTISAFFYDGPISRAVAFEGLLNDGKAFADRLISGFLDARDWPQLSHIATDGESYGHHHRYGEMALTFALNHIETNQLAELTNYGQFLEHCPPNHFVEIFPNTSWSCVHGVERWRSNCGCNSGGHPGWNQEWRAPLRAALDWLRDAQAPAYESKAPAYLKDPWRARDEYIRVILDRSDDSLNAFFGEHATHALNEEEKVSALKLLEMQRHAQLMYTSCGWFFDELSGIETVQVIQYAGRAVRLGEQIIGANLEAQFLDHLRNAKSNLPEHRDGALIYEKWVKPAIADIPQVGAHYAISSLFETYTERTGIYCYDVQREGFRSQSEGKMRLATGRARVSSQITREAATLNFGVLHLGDHNVTCGIRPAANEDAPPDSSEKLFAAFSRADAPEVIRLLDEGFGGTVYSLRSLFRDEQRKILDVILRDTERDATAAHRGIYQPHAQLMRFLIDLGVPAPKSFQTAAEITLNDQLLEALHNSTLDSEAILGLLKEAASVRVQLDVPTLEYAMRRKVEAAAAAFAAQPDKIEATEQLQTLLEFIEGLPFRVVLWEVQNLAYPALLAAHQKWRTEEEKGNPEAKKWLEHLDVLQQKLKLQIA
jgi:alpha-amylase/alpha-mannosidase (GH57 family)